jgi:hypothetical protein
VKLKTYLNKNSGTVKQLNKKMKTQTLIILILIWFPVGIKTNCFAQQKSWNTMEDIRQVTMLASAGKWETIKQDKGVTLSSRWLTFGDSLKTREISSRFVADADIQSVLAHLLHPGKVLAWNDGARSMKVLNREEHTWITHTVYDIPYPFSQQDLVVKNTMLAENGKTIILISALPDFIAPLKNVTRQQLYFGKWELVPLDSRTTRVSFSAISFSKSGIPRFVRDPVIQNKLFNSFVRLKELATATDKPAGDQITTHPTTFEISW